MDCARDLIILGDTARCLRGLINETDKISVAITDRNIKELLIDCDDVCRVKVDGKLIFKSKHCSSIEITDMKQVDCAYSGNLSTEMEDHNYG